ncbi:MAG: hypothetical protein HYV90_01920 [Candidatus Woesebacteria bacterium]|nr:MAG: hypothetical protein HYV90_01920 [Candidatus Woesebacteria bacterium]
MSAIAIEITASVGAAQAAFVRVLLSRGIEDPMRFLRKVDPKHHEAGALVEMRLTFWLNNNPGTSRVMDIVMGDTRVGWLPFSASLETASDEWAGYTFPHTDDYFKPELV